MNTTKATILAGSAANLVARIIGVDGTPITQDDIHSVHIDVFNIDEQIQVIDTIVLTAADCVFNSYQTGPLWIDDGIGYNFNHLMSGIAWFDPNITYAVVATFYPTVGDAFAFKHVWEVFAEDTGMVEDVSPS